ncbi:efflux RND transporter periplasmic adaptor subunit [Maribacter sp. HTCC2170]|uniref:efflux RND transporter periplasmic adaptor subunit n=1 Tax=Maribacter sp. (strain HTCC2170 / KCCM 42371) TaxID=313603 RepID=UPI00006B4756|nr:efflux RND transporter periplasmic adaptor subunit [Maribacter sp. HTCC2170]EAR01817.1 acriflavin resistance protein AcrE, putative [Maribacter sp. HTCC2170]
MKTKQHIITFFAIGLLFANCGDGNKKTVTDNSPAVTVSVSAVNKKGNSSFLSASGKIEAVNSANLSTRMMGHVDKIYVQVGDKVRKGQQLISISNTDLTAKLGQVNASITEARAAYTNADKDYKRFTALFNENSASQKELDDITANYNMAKARLEGAKQMKNEVNAQFSYANIRAPFTGTVTNKFINVGDMANPGMPLLEVESPGKFQVLAMVPESEILQIKANTEVDVVLKSLEETVKGKVVEVSTSAKNTGGQFMVKVELDKSDVNIMSGMYATVRFPVAKNETSETVMIPLDAIVNNGQLTGVYTVSESNTALLRWLRLGRTIGDQIEVLAGLTAEEQYIVSAEGKLFNGAKISIQ